MTRPDPEGREALRSEAEPESPAAEEGAEPAAEEMVDGMGVCSGFETGGVACRRCGRPLSSHVTVVDGPAAAHATYVAPGGALGAEKDHDFAERTNVLIERFVEVHEQAQAKLPERQARQDRLFLAGHALGGLLANGVDVDAGIPLEAAQEALGKSAVTFADAALAALAALDAEVSP